jgi:hypothetical protein
MEIIDEDVTATENRGRPSIYPWDKWLLPNKRVRLVQGVDFKIDPSSMRPQAHNQAKARGGKAHTSLGTLEGGRRYIDVTFKPGLTEEDVAGDFEFEKTG